MTYIKELRAIAYSIYLECDHAGPVIVMVLVYFLRFIETTSQPKFQRARPSSSRIVATLKMSKMQTHYFTDQNLNTIALDWLGEIKSNLEHS